MIAYKKDYVALAGLLTSALYHPGHYYASSEGENDYTKGVKSVAVALANYFAADNPKFDRAQFLGACGVVV